MPIPIARIAVALAAALLAGASAGGQSAAPVPIHLDVLHPPAPARGGGAGFLVYELHVTNFYTAPLRLLSVDVLSGGGATLRRYAGDSLAANLRHVGHTPDSASALTLEAGRRAMLFAWVPVDSGAPLPDTLRHRITLTVGQRAEPLTLVAAPVAVRAAPPVVLGPPLRGAGWIAGNGPRPEAVPVHNRLLYPRDGRLQVPQRFSSDWVKLGADGRVFHGDVARNESWYSYGAEVLAVADGIVAEVRDSVPDNTPPEVSTPITQRTVAGNFVVLDVGGDRYAVYGHLQPGSLRVRPGQRVRRGEVIARVGNSGNSTGPHLHFHVLDAPSTGAGEGVPFVFDAYELQGVLDVSLDRLEEGAAWRPARRAGENRRRDLPLQGSVVRF